MTFREPGARHMYIGLHHSPLPGLVPHYKDITHNCHAYRTLYPVSLNWILLVWLLCVHPLTDIVLEGYHVVYRYIYIYVTTFLCSHAYRMLSCCYCFSAHTLSSSSSSSSSLSLSLSLSPPPPTHTHTHTHPFHIHQSTYFIYCFGT